MATRPEYSLLEKTARIGTRVTHGAARASQLRAAAAFAVEDGMAAARRWARRSRRTAEDMIDEAAYRVRRDPLRSVGVGFAIGVGVGALLTAWRASRDARR